MTREQFKDLAMNILSEQEIMIGRYRSSLFYSDNIDNFKVSQYDDEDWDVIASYPLDEFLDELYDAIMCEKEKDNG